jgi:uncharacterized protein (DUF433 family)
LELWIFQFCSLILMRCRRPSRGRDTVYGRIGIMIDWSRCAEVESKPDVMSGAFVVRGTRVLAQAVIDNANDGYTAEQIVAEIYPSLPVEPARRVIAFARRTHAAAAAP